MLCNTCDESIHDMQAYASILGLHRNVLSAVPLFVVYLATLMHVYALTRQQGQTIANSPSMAGISPSPDLEAGGSNAGRPSRVAEPARAAGRFSR